jgi:hypothetical protein
MKDRTHTTTAKEYRPQAPEMSHPILQRVKMYNLKFFGIVFMVLPFR